MLPPHLAERQPQGLRENEPIAQFELGSLRNFVYLILDWPNRKAAIVDPNSEIDPPLSALKKYGFELQSILLTHTHHDHVGGVAPLMNQYPSIQLFVHPKDLHRFSRELTSDARVRTVQDGETLHVGSIAVEVLYTPGHSPGECCYQVRLGEGYLLTGDTVFIRDCGRTDFVGGSNEEMFASLQKIKRLAPQTVFLPGHHYAPECATTLERELKESPPFRCKTVEELEALP